MGVKQISEITRRDIAMLFVDGYYDYSRYWPDSKYSSLDDAKIFYPYYGRLEKPCVRDPRSPSAVDPRKQV